SRDSGKAIADVITMHDEVIDDTKPYEIFDPEHIWKRKTVTNFTALPLQEQIFKAGQCVYECPDIQTVQTYCRQQIDTLWDEMLRFENPHRYYVDLSQALWDEKQRLLSAHGR
ncbi:MAG: nicotinate phosphoribosyltransferase, partial [Clostridia bacterium]|nr:nicotinate phosphoribosyltransferase [Clostridia bacterium]